MVVSLMVRGGVWGWNEIATGVRLRVAGCGGVGVVVSSARVVLEDSELESKSAFVGVLHCVGLVLLFVGLAAQVL